MFRVSHGPIPFLHLHRVVELDTGIPACSMGWDRTPSVLGVSRYCHAIRHSLASTNLDSQRHYVVSNELGLKGGCAPLFGVP